MTAAYGQVGTGYWPAVVIGVVLLLMVVVTTVAVVRRARRRRRGATTPASTAAARSSEPGTPKARCRVLIEEALIVRERVSGQIDAATYQARMNDLASGGRS